MVIMMGKFRKMNFASALSNMKIKLSNDEAEILFKFIDLDGSGVVEYKEFLRKLKRTGVNIRKKRKMN